MYKSGTKKYTENVNFILQPLIGFKNFHHLLSNVEINGYVHSNMANFKLKCQLSFDIYFKYNNWKQFSQNKIPLLYNKQSLKQKKT